MNYAFYGLQCLASVKLSYSVIIGEIVTFGELDFEQICVMSTVKFFLVKCSGTVALCCCFTAMVVISIVYILSLCFRRSSYGSPRHYVSDLSVRLCVRACVTFGLSLV